MSDYIWSLEECIKLTNHKNPTARVWALEKLTELYPESAKDALVKAISDENALVTYRVMPLIARIEDGADFFEPLLKKFDSAEDWQVSQCAIALGALKYREAIPKLVERLNKDDTNPNIWESIVLALGEMQDDEAFKVLEELEAKTDDPQKEASIVSALLRHNKPMTYVRLVRKYLKSGSTYEGNNWMITLLINHLNLASINYIIEQAKFSDPKDGDLDEVFSFVERGIGISVSETPEPDWMKSARKAYKNQDYQRYARELLMEIQNKLKEHYPDVDIAFDEDKIEGLQDNLTNNELLIFCSLLPFAKGWKGAMSRKDAANLIKDEARFITACLFQIAGSKNWEKEIDMAKGDEEKLLAILTTPTAMESNRIVDEVASLGEDVVSSLVSILESWPGDLPAIRIIRVLEKIRSESSIPALIECGTHPSEYIRAAATNALAAFGEPILDHLKPTLKEELVYRNLTTFNVLARIPTESSADIVISNFDKLLALGTNMVSLVCREIGSKRFIAPLRGMLSNDNMSTIGETLAVLCAINDMPFPEAEALREDRVRRLRELHRQQRRTERGTIEIEGEEIKEAVGRNDPCPCGSGKKYKNCCMRKKVE